jgi:uncharacterized protein
MTALTAPYVLEYTYRRSTGPVIGRFLGALKDSRIEGMRTKDGRVIVPALEYDPENGDALSEFVEVKDCGTVQSWAWVYEPRETHPLSKPFAWVMVKLDGASTAITHALEVDTPELVSTGMRVKVDWQTERMGFITDIRCFVPETMND